jgi:hypothetical protein
MNPIEQCRIEGVIFKRVFSTIPDFEKAADFTFGIAKEIFTAIDALRSMNRHDEVEHVIAEKVRIRLSGTE